MRLKFFNIISLFLYLFLSTQVWANIQLIAYPGIPAVGFPEGFVYYGVDDPVIGSSGHVAFSGVADTDIRSTANNTNAVWAGLPGQLELVVKENDVIAGFPTNVFFDTTNRMSPVVTSSGAVAVLATLKGATAGNGLLVRVNGATHGIVKAGDAAPGFPAGTSIAAITSFSFSDKGMVFGGTTLNGFSFNFGIWFWDFNKIERISSPVTDCYFSTPTSVNMNSLGEVVFSALLLQNNSSQGCATVAGGIFKWSNGNTELLLAEGTPIPGKPDHQFIGISLLLPITPLIINNQSEIIFSNGMSIFGGNLWVIGDSNEPRPLILHDEKLASNPNDIISALLIPFIGYDFSDNGFSIIPVFKTDGLSALLTGKPKTSPPYDTGVSQLVKIASQNDQPPGFESNWFFTGFLRNSADSVSYLTNNAEQYIFMANAKNGLDGSVMNAIWRGEGSNRPRLVVKPGMKLSIGGQEYELVQIGAKLNLSDNGHIVFTGVLAEGKSGDGIFLASDDNQQQQVFTLAEQIFPQYFLPANADNQFLDGFAYRHYPTTNTYIGIKNGEVFVLGETFGEGVQRIDTVENTVQFLKRTAGF